MPDLDLERELDDLFGRPPDGFVATRTELVRRLKADGRPADATMIKGWRRPTRSVWALNQVARSASVTVAHLVASAGEVADLQAHGSPGLRAAIADLRCASHELTEAAVEAMGSGRPADREDVSAALATLVGDPAALGLLARGRLLEVPPAGLGAFGFATGSAPSEPDEAQRDRSRPDRADKDALASRRAIHEAEAAVAAAEEGQREARTGARAAKSGYQRATDRLERARAELAEAEAEVEAAAGPAEAARSTEAAADEAVREAQTTLARLRGESE